jgi:hypothetical protein
MSESRSSSQPGHDQPAPEQPIQRPLWRFSGRRGTPVHLREETPATLPKEIRQAIVQMAKERLVPQAAAPEQATGTGQDVQPGQAPPVAAAALPVERRGERDSAPDAVTTSPILPPSAATEPEATQAPAPVETPPAKPKSGPRPILAGDREVARTEAVSIEPAPPNVPAVDPVAPAAATQQPDLPPGPATAQDPSVPDQLPAAVFESTTADEHAAAVAGPDPMGAIELGRQAAWELGRLPILLHVTSQPPAPAPAAERPAPVELQPTQWRPVGTDRQPATIDPADAAQPMPGPGRRPTQSPTRSQGLPARARDGAPLTPPPATRDEQARDRAARRRRDLDQVVNALAGLTASRTGSDDT